MSAVIGAQPRGPALELGERTREALPPSLRQLDGIAVAVAHIELAEALAHEQLLELRVLLEVELLVPELDLVQRRHGDIDVPPLEQPLPVPVQEGEHERADVRAVH